MRESGKAISLIYASQDAEAVKRICDFLRAAELEVWFDPSDYFWFLERIILRFAPRPAGRPKGRSPPLRGVVEPSCLCRRFELRSKCILSPCGL
jgi:hypothetical protein